MKFHIADIRDGLDLAFTLSGGEFDELLDIADDSVSGAEPGLTVDIRIERVVDTILIRGNVEAKLAVQCVRCLAPFDFAVQSDIDAALFPRTQEVEEEAELELTEEDLALAYYEGTEIDLTTVIREAVLLDLPGYPAHAEDDADCKPLLADLQANGEAESSDDNNDSIDPRWAALAAIKRSMPD